VISSGTLTEEMQKTLTTAERETSQTALRPRISVVIVTYASSNELDGCMGSLLKQTLPIEIFLVDNASPDHTPEMVEGYARSFANVHAILNANNIGLAAANNSPLGRCQGDYVLILNPDTVLRDNTLERLVNVLDENPDVGIVGPKNLYEDGTPHSSFHRAWGISQILLWRILPYRFARYIYDRFSRYRYEEKLFVSGACLMIRRSIYDKIGGYDPEYFLTVEDACDLCIRTKHAGFRVVFTPDAEVVHLGGKSGAQAHYTVIWQGCRGSVYHFLKHKGAVQAAVVLALLIVSSGLRAGVAAALGIFSPRYKAIANMYGRVFWSLLVRNPIRMRTRRPCSTVYSNSGPSDTAG
jgi:GT2 family glycosyltransferase